MRRYRGRRRSRGLSILFVLLAASVVHNRCRDRSSSGNVGRTAEAPARDTREIEQALVVAKGAEPRDGLAAAIAIDVSGSMDDRVSGEDGRRARKIDVARRAARDLVEQFAGYADEHPDEPVLLGIYEFSRRDGQPDCRPVIPMSRPDRSRADEALSKLAPGGGTPIGQAMIAATHALDATGLTRRHLLLVSDGENTDGFAPDDVAAAITKRTGDERPAIYFVAFDIEARRFAGVRDAGALVLPAASAKELNDTLDMLLRGKILIEK